MDVYVYVDDEGTVVVKKDLKSAKQFGKTIMESPDFQTYDNKVWEEENYDIGAKIYKRKVN